MLRLRLSDAYNHLFHFDKEAETWNDLSISERVEWSENILQLVKYSAQINFAENEMAPIPEHLYQIVKSFEICQRLAWLNEEKTKFKDYHFDLSAISDIIRDPYLNLGRVGSDLLALLNRLKGKNPLNSVRLINSKPNYAEKKIYANFEKDLSPAQKKDLYLDLGDKDLLPKNIVHLRQMNILIMMMTARYRTLHYPGLWTRVKAITGGCINFISETLQEKKNPSMRLIEPFMKKIDDDLEKIGTPTSFVFTRPHVMSSPTPKIKPYGLHLHDYNEPSFESIGTQKVFVNTHYPSIYKETGPAIHTAGISERLIEGIISNQDDIDAYENGKEYLFSELPKGIKVDRMGKVHTYGPAGSKKTERTILDEKFRFQGQQFDVSADLQLMQTDPLQTRIQNTLGTFVKHSGCLADPKSGHEWQRVFALNLFRNGALHQFLGENPHYIESVVHSLVDITKQLEYNGKSTACSL